MRTQSFHEGIDIDLTEVILLRARRPPSRDKALGDGSDFASRCSVLDYRAEGYVGQVGASIDLTHHTSWYTVSLW